MEERNDPKRDCIVRRNYLKAACTTVFGLSAAASNVTANKQEKIVLPIGEEIPASEVEVGGTRGNAEKVRPDHLPDLPIEAETNPTKRLSASERAKMRANRSDDGSPNTPDYGNILDFNGWAGSTEYWHNDGEHIDYFYCNWDCPDEPDNQDTDATHFFFPALQSDGSSTTILQPVLEWNNGNGPNWQMRCWYGGGEVDWEISEPIEISEGNTLEGAISRNIDGTWTISGTDLDAGESTVINTGELGIDAEFRWALAAYEMYDFPEGDCNKLPSSCFFTNVSIEEANGDPIDYDWSINNEEDIGCDLSVYGLENYDEVHIYL